MIHPAYPGMVKDALVSDFYWHVPSDELVIEPVQLDPVKAYRGLKQYESMVRDKAAINRIKSLMFSWDAQSSYELVERGEDIPELHDRQILIATEDSRLIQSRFSMFKLGYDYIDWRYRTETGRSPQKQTFEEQIRLLYDDAKLHRTRAEAKVGYDMTRIARISRAVLCMVRDKETGLFSAMDLESLSDGSYLSIIPDVPLGAVYSKNRRGINHLGKIISAHILTINGVTWKSGGRPPGSKKDKKIDDSRTADTLGIGRLRGKLALGT